MTRVDNSVVSTVVSCSFPTSGCRALAAIMRVLYTGLLLHLHDNNSYNNNRTERRNSIFLRSPHCAVNSLITYMLKWPGCNHVQIMCNTSTIIIIALKGVI